MKESNTGLHSLLLHDHLTEHVMRNITIAEISADVYPFIIGRNAIPVLTHAYDMVLLSTIAKALGQLILIFLKKPESYIFL